jgi:hypothetical protein
MSGVFLLFCLIPRAYSIRPLSLFRGIFINFEEQKQKLMNYE